MNRPSVATILWWFWQGTKKGAGNAAGSDVRDERPAEEKTHPAFWRSSVRAIVLAILDDEMRK